MRTKKRNTNLNILRDQIKKLEISQDELPKAQDSTEDDNLKPRVKASTKSHIKGRGRIKDQLINTSRLLTFDG